MGINRGKAVNKLKIYASIFIIFISLFSDIILLNIVESCKRQQARCNIEHSLTCFKRYEANNGTLDISGIRQCVDNQRTSLTGDMYLLDMEDLQFIYDPSNDVPKNEKLYFTKDSIGKYFSEWDTAASAILNITSGNSSNEYSKVSYNFDGSTEWLEYSPYTTVNGSNYVLVQGTQRDEAIELFNHYRLFIGVSVFLYVLWLISTSFVSKRRDDARHTSDCYWG